MAHLLSVNKAQWQSERSSPQCNGIQSQSGEIVGGIDPLLGSESRPFYNQLRSNIVHLIEYRPNGQRSECYPTSATQLDPAQLPKRTWHQHTMCDLPIV